MTARRPRSAYTLFELILVMAIISMVAALAYPSIEAMYGDYRLTAGVDQVRAAWAAARAHALDEGRPYRFAILPNQGNYRVAPDSADFWAGSGGAADAAQASTPPYILEETLPRGVRMALSDTPSVGGADDLTSQPAASVDAGQWTPVAVFLPDSTARDDAEIVFQTRGCRPRALRLRALTGIVTPRILDTDH